MTPLDVLSLEDAKQYLQVDFSDDDDLITALIETAVLEIEKETEYRLYQRTETLLTSKIQYTAFQFPFNAASVVSQDSADTNTYTMQLNYASPNRVELFWGNGFQYIDSNQSFFTNYTYGITACPVTFILSLDVGYTDTTLIPNGLITAVKQTIVFLYENRDLAKVTLPDNIQMLCAPYKRFTYFL